MQNSIMTICKKAPESNLHSIHLNYNDIIIIPMLELYTPSAGISSFQQHTDFVCAYCPCRKCVFVCAGAFVCVCVCVCGMFVRRKHKHALSHMHAHFIR